MEYWLSSMQCIERSEATQGYSGGSDIDQDADRKRVVGQERVWD